MLDLVTTPLAQMSVDGYHMILTGGGRLKRRVNDGLSREGGVSRSFQEGKVGYALAQSDKKRDCY